MHMGANGFLWVRWGAGGARSTKTRQAGGIYGRADQDLGAMAGEISPDMMFWEVRQKASRMGVDGYRLIRVGANGRRGKEGSKNEAKRSTNGRSGHILRRMQTVKETSKSRAMVMELGGKTLGMSRCGRCVTDMYAKGRGEKERTTAPKKRKRASENMLYPLICIAKTASTKQRKTNTKKSYRKT